MAGASWVQKEILKKYPGADIQVYAVWLPMLLSDNLSRRGAGQLTDARVKHYWDGEKIAGKWYAQTWGYENVIAWDVYFLYGSEAEWDSVPAPLISWGYPVIDKRDQLSKEVSKLFSE